MTRSDWQDALDRYEDLLEPHTRLADDGPELTDEAPAAWVKVYDYLICYGLEREWLDVGVMG